MKKTIYSVDGYSELNVEFNPVDFVGANDIKSLLQEITDGTILYAKKDISVYASNVVLGSEVDIRTRFNMHGRAYTFEKEKKRIEEKDVETNTKMILYTDGQTVLVRGEKFEETYKLENKTWELYKPIDFAKKYVTLTKNIYYKTPWGEIVFAPSGSKLCIEYLDTREFFIVTNSFFKTAYRLLGEIGTLDDLQIKNTIPKNM